MNPPMYLTIYFGLELDDKVIPNSSDTEGGVHYHGPNGLLMLLESHLGLINYAANTEYLRIAQYRQALQEYLKRDDEAFFKRAFEADQLATAEELLSKRDELLLAGWDFESQATTPTRLQVLSAVETILQEEDEIPFVNGFADRFVNVLHICQERTMPIERIYLNEPIELLPFHLRHLIDALTANGTTVTQLATPIIKGNTDLNIFQKALQGNRTQKKLKNDGSLLVLQSKRDTDAAAFLAQLFRLNPSYRPVCLIPEKTRVLDTAMIEEGLPSQGILSASLARPSLQILKLATVFLWRPIDPYKVLEFVTLSVKPIESDLAIIIARLVAQKPGLNSDAWYAAINEYFETLEKQAKTNTQINVYKIRKQYQFWFERKRYNITKSVPREEVIEIYEYLAEWAVQAFEAEGSSNQSLLVLAEQAKRIKELLEALPESYNFINNLELERIVRTIYAPSPVQFKKEELHHLAFVHHPSAFIRPSSDLLWWNFSQSEHPSFFSKWYQTEISYLADIDIFLDSPQLKNARLVWQRKRPIFQATNRLVLVIPERVAGSEVLAHPLLGDLHAIFNDLSSISYDIDNADQSSILEAYFQLPSRVVLEKKSLQTPSPILFLDEASLPGTREHETFSSLTTLLYYPYQWFFQHKALLRKSSLLSVARDNRLKGNLSHRFIELLLNEHKEDLRTLGRGDVHRYVEEKSLQLLAKEGATLLLYGKEPERLAFLNKVKYAAWSLVKTIQDNNWQVRETEMDLMGHFLDVPIKVKADLVLARGEESAILDLKWTGSNYRRQTIQNEEDLQLVLYAKLLDDNPTWAHTGYFILDKGEVIARNNEAFTNCEALQANADHIAINERILSKMEATYRWRQEQLQKGHIEVRTDHTQQDLEELYAGQLMDLLELKEGNAPFDDYQVLIGGGE